MERKKPGPRKGSRNYTPEERAEAVRIVRASKGRSIVQVAADLGLNDKTLNEWVVKARNAEIDPEGSLTDAARQRIRRLEEENAKLRKDLEFERKARAFVQSTSLKRSDSR
jgi:transposase